MKTIYLCQTPQTVKSVYDTDEQVYSKDDILSRPEQFKDTEIIFSTWGMPQFTEPEIKTYLPSLKAVFYGAGSVQGFAREFLNCGVKVFSAWAANAVPVAEYTVAQIILSNKGFFRTMRFTNIDEASDSFRQYPGNYNVKVGIIGAGMIGKLVINKLKDYNINVLVFDPFLSDEEAEELKITKTSLEKLFAECQVVSNHLANNQQTKGMLKKSLFQKMLPYATFINTGRGAQVVEKDLIEALEQRQDLTAILDVTDPEPPVTDSKLYTLDNCILTPHIAGSSGNELLRMGNYMKAEYDNFMQNNSLKYEVTLDMLKTMA